MKRASRRPRRTSKAVGGVQYVWARIGKPDVDLHELATGVKVEQEHGVGPVEAGRIALDHLDEFADYYTRLTKMEARAKKGLPPNPQKRDIMKRTSRRKRGSRRNPPEIKIKGTKVYVDGEHTATIIGSRSRITSGPDAGGVAPQSGYGIWYVGEDRREAYERQATGEGHRRHLPYSYFRDIVRYIRDGAIPARRPQPNRRRKRKS